MCLEIWLTVLLAAGAFLLQVPAEREYILEPATLESAAYPEWAHYHWVWLSNDRANQSAMMEYAQEYLHHNISVGAVDIESGWSTGFNNFQFDTHKYPNASEMIDYFHSKKIRVILWATSMIDTDSSNYKEAHDKKYLLRNAVGEQATISWWHGKGGLLDYTNTEAVDWWHKQLDKVLSLGIDGWKCDGTDPYVYELVVARGEGGVVSRKDYSDAYYGDFFDYTRKKLGTDRLIMSRPVDGFDFVFLDFSPKRVMLSGWVGDNDPTFTGMETALKSYLQSAWAGYANFGSDIGGYRSGNGTWGRTKEVLIRWAQLGAFSPLMENGGNKEHRPWVFDNETLEIYRKFVDIHYELVSYLLTTGTEALENGGSSIIPLAKHDNFIRKLVDIFDPSTYNYLLGSSILVAPMYQNGQETVNIEFPKVNGYSKWTYYFNHSIVYQANTTVSDFKVPLHEYAVFCSSDTIIPLKVTTATPILGRFPSMIDRVKWWLYLTDHTHQHPSESSPQSFRLREQNGHGVIATWSWLELDHAHCIQVNISAHQTVRSVVEIETMSFPRIQSLVQVVSYNGNQKDISLYEDVSDVVHTEGRAVVTKDRDGVLKVTILPFGITNGKGHSFTMCFGT